MKKITLFIVSCLVTINMLAFNQHGIFLRIDRYNNCRISASQKGFKSRPRGNIKRIIKMKKVLSVNNIVKSFHQPEDFQVLKGVDFDVEKGEFVSIIGKSGSGKSTLLYILSTMDTDYNGSITINDSNVTGVKQNKLAAFRNEHIGFVFQFHFLLPEFSVIDNVMLPALKWGKKPKDIVRERALELLKMLDVAGQEEKKASLLSGGQQQRVAIARALINEPTIIMPYLLLYQALCTPSGHPREHHLPHLFDIDTIYLLPFFHYK